MTTEENARRPDPLLTSDTKEKLWLVRLPESVRRGSSKFSDAEVDSNKLRAFMKYVEDFISSGAEIKASR